MYTRILILLAIISPYLYADVAIESYGQKTLDTLPPHTVSINTFNSTIMIYDAGNGQVLGMLSVGYGVNAIEFDKGKNVVYAAETYLSRHTRGERTDVITTYDMKTLSAVNEIVIPPKHVSGSPMRHYSGILRQGSTELMLVTNITPAVSISIVDLGVGKFVNEINTAGCGLVYPSGELSFLQLCGDGTAQLIRLDADGQEVERSRSEVFFDLQIDPLMEKAVQTPGGWIFNTFQGDVYQVSFAGGRIDVRKLFKIASDNPGWRVGGMQPLAYHTDQNLLLALMHQGGEDSHKDPGTEVWYYDLSSGRLTHRLSLQTPSFTIQVSQDDAPLLYVGSLIMQKVDVYDLKTGVVKNSIGDLTFPTILQNLH